MSEINIVSNNNNLLEIEVGLMLSEALKEIKTMLMSQKVKKTPLDGINNDVKLES